MSARRFLLLPALVTVTSALGLATPRASAHGESTGLDTLSSSVDHHVHLFSPESRAWLANELGLGALPPLDAPVLLPFLDTARIRRAAVLSSAYFFMPAGTASAGVLEAVRTENDWVAAEVGRYPDRLVGFFSVNPLSEAALEEMDRASGTGLFVGLKLHFANSAVDLRDPEHIGQLVRVFQRAEALGLPVVVHMRTRRTDYGRPDALAFIDQVLATAPGVRVQVAHAAGWGGYDPPTDGALQAFAERMASGALRRDRIWFDLAAVVRAVRPTESDAFGSAPDGAQGWPWWPDQRYARLVAHLRDIGWDRVLFATDWPDWHPAPYRAELATHLPLREGELERILDNTAPWMTPD